MLITGNKGILGMNARNLKYIRTCNLRNAKKLADNKLKSKQLLRKNKLPTPKLIAKIQNYEDLDGFDFNILPPSFVLKPNLGLGGEGILVVYGKSKNEENVWIKADGGRVSEDDLKIHIRNILDGSFSRINTPDIAFFEERIRLSKIFKPYSYKGMPDVRVIVYNNVPVMAMLRLATEVSGGRANLQLGGIGCGIDMSTGTTTSSIQGKNRVVEYVPNSRMPLRGVKIPFWNEILEMAIKAQQVSKIGYLGADIALDRERGPVFLELNARPGLSIQIANIDGLLTRLRRVEGLKVSTIKRGVQLAKNLFGGEIEEELEEISGKRIISTTERVKLIAKNGKEIEIETKIDTGAFSTSIDVELAEKLGFSELIKYFDTLNLPEDFSREEVKEVEGDLRRKHVPKHQDLEDIVAVYSSSGITIRPKVKISFVMDKRRVYSRANIIERGEMKYSMIIGRNDLRRYLVEVE